MIRRITIILIIIAGLLIIPPVLGTENKVTRGGTVYVGEADLDISDCNVRNGDEIAWWESGNPEGTPTARGRVEDVRRFTVDPQTFRGHKGSWYGLVSKKMVFNVEEPFLQFDIVENGIDTEPASIKRGNLVSFKISTNLADISKRAGSSGAIVTIKMTGPNETEYHTLKSTRTEEFNLDKVFVYTSPYDTGVVWDTTDEDTFPDGEYIFSASTNVNRIDEILPEVGISSTEEKTYTLGKTEVKPDEKEEKETKEEKEDKNSNKKKSLSSESTSEPTPTETPEDDEKSTSKSVKDDTDTEKTTKPTPEETSSGKSSKKKTTPTPTQTETPEETQEPTPEITRSSTPLPTEEPTPVITPHATRTPLPRPPSPGTSPTKAASPLPAGIIVAALGAAGLLVTLRRRQ